MKEWYQEIQVKKLSETIYRITNPTKEHMFLVIGSEKAVLIDAGAGYGDLRSVLRSLTALPVVLVNTHGHPDHIGGSGFFEGGYLHKDDMELVEHSVSWQSRKEFMSMIKPELADTFDQIPHVETGAFQWDELTHGQVFSLGDVELEVVATPGHSKGSVCFLHRQERVLFAGDTLGRKTVMLARGATSLVEFMATLRDIQEMLPNLDIIYGSHNEGIIPKEAVWNLISCCIDILNNMDDKVEMIFNQRKGYLAKRFHAPGVREDGVFGNIAYDPERLTKR